MNIWSKLTAGCQTSSPEETRKIAAQLAEVLPTDATLALHGGLGVGKTTFTGGLAEGLGVAVPVTSPTFQLYSIYQGKDRRILHLDAYRLESPEAAEDLLLDDFLISPYLLIVEWPENILGWLPSPVFHLDLSTGGDSVHTIHFRADLSADPPTEIRSAGKK